MASCLNTAVLKIASRCNLNCSYCYVYNHEDKSYRDRPKFMSDTTYHDALMAMRRYCEQRGQHRMAISFHGGEPTLVGARRFDQLAQHAKDTLGEYLGGLAIQTNATLVDSDWIEVLVRHCVRIGISLDGPADVHDSMRIDHAGRGSHRETVAGLRKLQQTGARVFVLCVVNPAQSGLRIYRYFRDLGLRHMDFLFPDVSHDNKAKWYGRFGPTPVADYLIPVFGAWMKEDDPEVNIRVFLDLLRAAMGGSAETDAFGNPQMGYLIVETDGSIEGLDALRVCEEGIQRTGLNVKHHGFDDLEQGLPLVNQLVNQGIPLPSACEDCFERDLCGGGYLPHRYSRANGFDNPSVWCADILKLIAYMRTFIEGECTA